MNEIIDFIAQNWNEILTIYFGIVGVASVIVRLTPTIKDDNFLKKVLKFTGKYIALNRK